jgi:subtilisin family serine protease
MSNQSTYTYRGGRKLPLVKSDNQLVVRLEGEALGSLKLPDGEQVSPASTRITLPPQQLEDAMRTARELAPTHHAYYEEESGQEFLITDRILVSFRDPVPDAVFDAFTARYALRVLARYSDRDFLLQLSNHTGMNPVKLVVKLTEEEPRIASAEHDLNQRLSTSAYMQPSDPVYQRQWHLHTHSGSPDFDLRASSHCEEAWQLLDGFGDHSVVVGLSDDGCKLDHPDFDSPDKFASWGYMRGNRLVVRGDVDALPSAMYKSGANHGTSCAGVIAGETDGVLTVGAAPGCRLLPIQWESSGPSLFISDSKLLTVLNFIADKVDVFSNSWGGVPVTEWAMPVVNRIRELALAGGRRGKGILFLWAAGNENCPIQHDAGIDVPYDHGVAVQGGALVWVGVRTTRRFRNNLTGIPGLLHIAALASTARRSHYSNYGTGIALCAPSSNSHAYYRMTVRGLGIATTTGQGSGSTEQFGGTSSATPLVAGVAALVISADPQLSALEVASILQRTASKDLDMTPYAKTPPASFDPDTSWDVSPIVPFDQGVFVDTGHPDGTWSPWFGHGCVDAAEAVRKALLISLQPEDVRIVSALVNPSGTDRNKESVTLENRGTLPVELQGWMLENQNGRKHPLSGRMEAGDRSVVRLTKSRLRLRNTGGRIRLNNALGRTVHEVQYRKAEVKAGVEVEF